MDDLQATTEGLDPRPVHGRVRVPASKSLAQRAIVLAGLARGETRLGPLQGLPAALLAERPPRHDVAAALAFAESLGCEVRVESTSEGASITISGRGGRLEQGAFERPTTIEVGESATLGRFALAVCALVPGAGRRLRLHPRGTLRTRRSPGLVRTLEQAGAGVEFDTGCSWPITVDPAGEVRSLRLVDPVSSQELSSLWIAAAATGRRVEVHVEGDVPSAPYLALTEDVLSRFGARLARVEGSGPHDRVVEGTLTAPGEAVRIEPDASAAAVALAAGCLSRGSVTVAGLDADSRQGDVRILEHLAAFGCNVEPGRGVLTAHGFPTRPAPVLAVVGAAVALADPGADSTVLTGLRTLSGKESDRVAVLANLLRASGVEVNADTDRLEIAGCAAVADGRPPSELLFDPRGDHRMAFAGALLGLVRPGVRISGARCVAKSWPDFFTAIRECSGTDA
ncbi:MAG: 3-phosphoshikimate 1-carboxyvinyltransferase [Planctomycetota bacterium]|jgi:3-phosphoshikimate 1-carboxyvinyltransferase